MFSSHKIPLSKKNINLDLDLVDGFHQPRLRSENTGVQDTSSRGDDLTATTVDGVSVQSHVVKVKPDGSHVFVAESSLETHKMLFLQTKDLSCRVGLRYFTGKPLQSTDLTSLEAHWKPATQESLISLRY